MSVKSQSISVAMHQEWSAGQMRFADWGQCGLEPGQAVTGSLGAVNTR